MHETGSLASISRLGLKWREKAHLKLLSNSTGMYDLKRLESSTWSKLCWKMVWGVCHAVEMNNPPCATGQPCQSCRIEACKDSRASSCNTSAKVAPQLVAYKWKKTYLSLPAKLTSLSTNATSGSGRIPDVFTTPSASVCSQAQSNVGTDEEIGCFWQVYCAWKSYNALNLICIDKGTCWQKVRRLMYSLSFPKVDLSSVFIRVNGETNAAWMSYAMFKQRLSSVSAVKYVLFPFAEDFNWNLFWLPIACSTSSQEHCIHT